MRRRFVLVLMALSVVGAGLLGAPVPREGAVAAPLEAGGYQAKSPEYGMSVFVFGHAETTARDLQKLQALGFGWQKTLFPWRHLERACKGCFDWEESDRVVAESARAGLRIVARLDFQPAWARGDGAFNGPPDNYQDYADFVGAFVSRYRAGSPRGTVQAIEVWNEVNLAREWGDQPISAESAADYVRFLTLAYQAAKAADPSVTVITAALSPTGWSDHTARPDDVFLHWMYDAGLKASVNYDVLGVNGNVMCPCIEHDPNSPTPPEGFSPATHSPSFYFRQVERVRDIMVARGEAGQQIWLMEFGWTADPVNPTYSWAGVSEEMKADLVVRAFKYAAEHWSPWIGVMLLWNLPDPSWTADREEYWWSIAEPDGSPRAAYERLLVAAESGELPNLQSHFAVRPAVVAPPAVSQPPLPDPATDHSATTPELIWAGTRLRVVGAGLEGTPLRESPSGEANVVATIYDGAMVESTGGSEWREGVLWRNVRDADGVEGWIAADVLRPG